MFRIWAKLLIDNKIVKDMIYTVEGEFLVQRFYDYVEDMCHELDIPIPIVLTKHIKNFLLFNSTFFTQEDFVETFYEDKFVIEIVKG